MFNSLQLLTSLQFQVYFVCLLKNIKDCVLDKYEWFLPRYIPLTDKSWSDIWSHRSEYHWKDYIFNNDKDNNNDIDILRCELHLFENIFSKTALSYSRFFLKEI